MNSVTERLDLFVDAPGRALPSLRVAAPIAAIYYTAFCAWHLWMLPDPQRHPLIALAAVTVIAMTALSALARRAPAWVHQHSSRLLLCVPIAAVANAGVHLWALHTPGLTTNLLLAVVLAGLLLRDGLGVLLVFLLSGVAFSATALRHPAPDWGHFGVALLVSVALATVVFVVRGHSARELAQLRDIQRDHRRSLERAVDTARKSETRYRALVDRCPDAIFMVQDGAIRYANPAAETLLDAGSGALVDRSVHELSADPAGRVLGDEVERLTLLDISGQRVSVSTTVVDVRQNNASTHLIFARDERARVAAEELRAEFMSSVSHELRTPLTSIAGAVRLLNDPTQERTSRDRTLLAMAERNTDRLGNLIEDLLDLRRLEMGSFNIAERFELRQAVTDTLPVFAQDAMSIDLDLSDDVAVSGDRDAVSRVVRHILMNARKFGRDTSAIAVYITHSDSEASVVIADRGPGIPRRHREQVMAGFFQGSPGLARPYGGFGVGLTIARGILEGHGGSLHLADREGGGAIVTATLPRAPSVAMG